jgi:hypothetical protein
VALVVRSSSKKFAVCACDLGPSLRLCGLVEDSICRSPRYLAGSVGTSGRLFHNLPARPPLFGGTRGGEVGEVPRVPPFSSSPASSKGTRGGFLQFYPLYTPLYRPPLGRALWVGGGRRSAQSAHFVRLCRLGGHIRSANVVSASVTPFFDTQHLSPFGPSLLSPFGPTSSMGTRVVGR